VLRKRANPTWYPPPSIREEDPTLPRLVRPGPDNPLGAHALYLGWAAILIHGTNQPYSIGRRVSHGCFRLHPDNIAILYREVPAGTPVSVVDQAIKIGWLEGHLYLEVHPTLSQATEMEETGNFLPEPAPDLRERVQRAAGASARRVDWIAVTRAAEARSGVPVRVTR
jgi:L,D-transpeptidase ErfK/SrfK